MTELMLSRTIGVAIACAPDVVYAYVANPENLPQWATTFCRAARREGAAWVLETVDGPATIRFEPTNALGVLDHVVTPAPGVDIYVPMRVLANGAGSTVLLTLFQRPEMSAAEMAEDIGLVERDLAHLKRQLEQGGP